MFRSLTFVPVLGKSWSSRRESGSWTKLHCSGLWDGTKQTLFGSWPVRGTVQCKSCLVVLACCFLCDAIMNSTALECWEASIKGPVTSFMTTSAQQANLWSPSREQMSASWSSGHTTGLKNAETHLLTCKENISCWALCIVNVSLVDRQRSLSSEFHHEGVRRVLHLLSQTVCLAVQKKHTHIQKRFTAASSSSLTSDMAFSVWTTVRCRSSDTSRTVCLSQRWSQHTLMLCNKWRSPVTLHRT